MQEQAQARRVTAVGSAEWIRHYGLSARQSCRMAQLEIARADERVFSVEGDLAMPSVPFHRELPRRFLQAGIAEADLLGIATGLALRGKIPFANSFASFLAYRAAEQMRLDVAYHGANVKVVGYYAGISGGTAASSHHATEDLAALRSLPGLTVISPADAVEAYKATWAAYRHPGPVYLRLGRAATAQVYFEDYAFEIGRAVRLREGSDLAVLATGGQMVAEALAAAELLAARGLSCRVVDVHTLKPLDRDEIRAAGQTGAVVTVEDHNVHGGLGCAVAEVLLAEAPAPLVRVGIPDRFCDRLADFEQMLPLYEMDAAGIARAGERAVRAKPGAGALHESRVPCAEVA